MRHPTMAQAPINKTMTANLVTIDRFFLIACTSHNFMSNVLNSIIMMKVKLELNKIEKG